MQEIIETTVNSITTDHIQKLCLGKSDAEKIRGRRILIVDDVISTGESIRSVEVLIEQVGGNIAGRMTVLAEGEAADRDDIIYLQRLPLFDKSGNPLG